MARFLIGDEVEEDLHGRGSWWIEDKPTPVTGIDGRIPVAMALAAGKS